MRPETLLFSWPYNSVFMAKSMQSEIRGNIMFNAARAHINQNDGFGLGTNVEGNLIYSSCRESSDHGPFNSKADLDGGLVCACAKSVRSVDWKLRRIVELAFGDRLGQAAVCLAEEG
eukprot:SAG25_NODE_149_length_13742_cov_17.202155_12_plen_117_part_00